MTTVALIGPDGAGKTTVAGELGAALSVPVRYLYMGVSAESSNATLPTTRLIHRLKRATGAAPDTGGPPIRDSRRRPHRTYARRRLSGVRAGLRLVNRLAEEWYRQWLAWRWQRRGAIVVFDRHFYLDYHAYDVTGVGRSLTQRLHGSMLARLYPKPDLVLYLDAPAEVLLERKGEGTIDALERRRADYRALRPLVPAFVEIDATAPLSVVVHAAAEAIQDHLRRSGPTR